MVASLAAGLKTTHTASADNEQLSCKGAQNAYSFVRRPLHDLKMHQCPVCPKSFPSPYKLQRHQLTHTGLKPFICKICGKAFTQSGHLKTHLRQVHRSLLPTDAPGDGVLSSSHQPKQHRAAAGASTLASSDYTMMSSVVPQPEWKSRSLTHEVFLASSETGNPPKNRPCVINGSVIVSSASHDADPTHQVHSANVDTSVSKDRNDHTCKICSKTFSTSLQLWIHLSMHNKPKAFQRGPTFPKKTSSIVCIQSQELNTDTSKITLKHQCPKCLKTFCSPSKLERHFLIHTGQKPYSCTICWKAFRQKSHLKSHLSTANSCSLSLSIARNRQGLCNDGQTLSLLPQSSLQQPVSHHGPVSSSVELKLQCKISVDTVQELNKAEIKLDAVVKQEPLNTDTQCQDICYTPGKQLQYVTQKDIKPFQCTICNRSFRLEVNLIRHQKIHLNQKELGNPAPTQNTSVQTCNSEAMNCFYEHNHADPVETNIVVKPETWIEHCIDSSARETLLQQKESCHATGKQQRMTTSHQCQTCSKCFPSGSKLQRHMMTHTGQRPFGCEVCGKRFRQKTHLRVHCRTHLWSRYQKQRSLYINRPPSRVSGFNIRTSADVLNQDALAQKKDVETHTGKDVISVAGLDKTPSIEMFQKNGKREPGNKLLPYTSKRNEVLKTNLKRTQTSKSMQNPGNVQHKCLQCLKCFPSASKLQRHEMVHTGLKPFQCPVCGKAFRQASHLKTHGRTHCKRKPPKPFNQRVDVRKLKIGSQQHLYPKITVRIPQQPMSASTATTHSAFDSAVSKGESAPLRTSHEKPVTKVNGVLKTYTKSNICKKKKVHICRICCKNFASPYKLSRHLVTHSGIRPYKCTLCSKTFTQRGHLKVHEQRCGQVNRISDSSHRETINTTHLYYEYIENLTGCTDFKVDATRDQTESHYNIVHSFTDEASSYCKEAIDTKWLEVPKAGLQEENNELKKKQKESYNQTPDSYDQAEDHCSYSFPSEVPNTAAPPSSHQYEGKACNMEITAVSDGNKALSDEPMGSADDNQTQADFMDDYWCEPIALFECDKCSGNFKSENDLRQHLCPLNDRPRTMTSAQKNHCNICFKSFASPSKLKRHYLVHTGQRPFHCDICGKAFTQSGHVRTHRLLHS